MERGGDGAFVVVASGEIYEPSHRHPGLIGEDLLGPRPPEHPVARRWWDVEAALRERLEGAALGWLVLRAAPVPLPLGGSVTDAVVPTATVPTAVMETATG